MASTDSPLTARTLLKQLDLIWLFAEQHVLPRIDTTSLHWEPSPNCVAVREIAGRFVADWPDENTDVFPETTVAWLLWHIEWWWSNTIAVCRGGNAVGPDVYEWSGTVGGIGELRVQWVDILETTELEKTIVGLMPDEAPLWEIAGWVNFELTKNVSEISQLLTRKANTRY
ncbi:DinB family protein [Rhodococcus sp. NPDC047139]|uniref:DinB family protein n=1 Tax=Rhodococcus sp. NPDC047139 TaxID=3155141 RepID=UPI0033C22683